MVEGSRFCGRCGHQLKPAARFCANCGNSVPGTAGQASAASRPEYAPTVTALPRTPPPSQAPPGIGPPPGTGPPGGGPPWHGTPARAPRRSALLWPVLAGLVILVAGGTAAWFFMFRDTPAQSLQANAASAPPASPRNSVGPTRGKTMSRSEESAELEIASRDHTVVEGETLFSLAQRYYGDGDRFADIYRANRKVLKTPDALAPGTVLVIPHAAEEPVAGEGGTNP